MHDRWDTETPGGEVLARIEIRTGRTSETACLRTCSECSRRCSSLKHLPPSKRCRLRRDHRPPLVQPSWLRLPQVMVLCARHCTSPVLHSSWQVARHAPSSRSVLRRTEEPGAMQGSSTRRLAADAQRARALAALLAFDALIDGARPAGSATIGLIGWAGRKRGPVATAALVFGADDGIISLTIGGAGECTRRHTARARVSPAQGSPSATEGRRYVTAILAVFRPTPQRTSIGCPAQPSGHTPMRTVCAAGRGRLRLAAGGHGNPSSAQAGSV